MDDIKSMADDLAKELYQSMIDGRLPNFSTHASRHRTTISAQDYNKLVQALHNSPVVPQSYKNRYTQVYPGISPTDNQSRGMYEYQEPEVDEQGTYYGYKVLSTVFDASGNVRLKSPRYLVFWSSDGQLESDREPSEDSMYGIHCTKRPDHPELEQYYRPFAGAIYPKSESVLVKCALSGNTIIETAQGFRAQHAQIIGVYQDGYWRSYQDYQERAYADSRRVAEAWEEEQRDWEDTMYYGQPKRNPYSYFDPSADS